MIEYSDIRPINKYEVERQIDNKYDIAFYDLTSVKELTKKKEDGSTHVYYSVNKYLLTLANKKIVNDNYDNLLQLAKDVEYNELSKDIRTKRDKLLSDTDWTMCTDSQLSEELKEKYRIYRQALRDIPEQSGFPYNVVFPTL